MKVIANPSELTHTISKRLSTGELLGTLANVSEAVRIKNLSIHHEILPPGHRSSPPHRHSVKEEFVYMLSGNPSMWLDGEIFPLFPGNVVGFPAGGLGYHAITNLNTTDTWLLVISTVEESDSFALPSGTHNCCTRRRGERSRERVM
jgi:uncharacterized cupin superfamily protein